MGALVPFDMVMLTTPKQPMFLRQQVIVGVNLEYWTDNVGMTFCADSIYGSVRMRHRGIKGTK